MELVAAATIEPTDVTTETELAIATEPDTIEQGLDEDYIANVSTAQTATWNPLFTQD